MINSNNKYLTDLGIRKKSIGINFCNKAKDERQEKWEQERKDYGFDSREVWNLDHTYIEWLYSHLKMYKDTTIVDMEKEIFSDVLVTKDEVITISMKDALDFMLKQFEKYLINKDKDYLCEISDDLYKALHMFADTFEYWWW